MSSDGNNLLGHIVNFVKFVVSLLLVFLDCLQLDSVVSLSNNHH